MFKLIPDIHMYVIHSGQWRIGMWGADLINLESMVPERRASKFYRQEGKG